MKFLYKDSIGRSTHCFIEQFGKTIVCTNDDYHPVMSITNAAEQLNEALKKHFGEDIVHIEHYDDGEYNYDLVEVIDGKARWKRLNLAEIKELGIYES